MDDRMLEPRGCLTAVVACVAAWLVSAALTSAAQAADGPAIVRFLNAQRTANGLPRLVEKSRLSSACRAHDRYMQLNPTSYPHAEQPGRPGYTSAGADVAARSVMARGVDFDHGVNPFEVAPFHLADLLRPELRVTGGADAHGWTCVVVRSAPRRLPENLRMFTYPGPGAGGVRTASVVAPESPVSPGELVGLAPWTVTGPTLYLLPFAPAGDWGMRIRSASLTGPGGEVPVRTVDAGTEGAAALLHSAALVLPVSPLQAGLYCATVRFAIRGLSGGTWRWWFRTEGADLAAPPPPGCVNPPAARLRLDSLRVRHGKVSVRLSVAKGARGRPVVLLDRYPAVRRMHRRGAPHYAGGRRRYVFTARLPGGIFRVIGVRARFKRTDGGLDERALRTLHLAG
jgi:hypothetical protein